MMSFNLTGMASNLIAMVSNLIMAMASNLTNLIIIALTSNLIIAMASNLTIAMVSNLIPMAFNLRAMVFNPESGGFQPSDDKSKKEMPRLLIKSSGVLFKLHSDALPSPSSGPLRGAFFEPGPMAV